MKKTIALFAMLFASSAFANIQMICNTKGQSMAQRLAGIPSTIMATIVIKDGDISSKSIVSMKTDKMRKISNISFDTPDENAVTAVFSTMKNKEVVKQQITFYTGSSANKAELATLNADDEQVDGSLVSYQCGTYDDGQY